MTRKETFSFIFLVTLQGLCTFIRIGSCNKYLKKNLLDFWSAQTLWNKILICSFCQSFCHGAFLPVPVLKDPYLACNNLFSTSFEKRVEWADRDLIRSHSHYYSAFGNLSTRIRENHFGIGLLGNPKFITWNYFKLVLETKSIKCKCYTFYCFAKFSDVSFAFWFTKH